MTSEAPRDKVTLSYCLANVTQEKNALFFGKFVAGHIGISKTHGDRASADMVKVPALGNYDYEKATGQSGKVAMEALKAYRNATGIAAANVQSSEAKTANAASAADAKETARLMAISRQLYLGERFQM